MSKRQIFLSYSAQDRKFVTAMSHELNQLGISIYDPGTELKAGENWRSAIRKGIQDSDAVVVVVTEPRETASGWMGYEVGSASAMGKNVFVMKSSSFSMKDLPSELTVSRVVDFDASSPRAAAVSLASGLRVSAEAA